jgi:hypothetical protein
MRGGWGRSGWVVGGSVLPNTFQIIISALISNINFSLALLNNMQIALPHTGFEYILFTQVIEFQYVRLCKGSSSAVASCFDGN